MKPLHSVPPGLAILGSAYWLVSSNNTITAISEKTKIIQERLVVVEKAAASAPIVVSLKTSSFHQQGSGSVT